MKKPALLFAIKCSVILYFAACTNIDKLTVTKSAASILTRSDCKVSLFTHDDKNQTGELYGYDLVFTEDGNLQAIKADVILNGNWHEDALNKTFMISFDTEDRTLDKLNYKWDITKISSTAVCLETSTEEGKDKLNLSNE